MKRPVVSVLSLVYLLMAGNASAQPGERALGEPRRWQGLEIAAAYSSPVDVEPPALIRTPEQADVHLKAAIRALPGNPQGFPADQWVPYLHVEYRLRKLNEGKSIHGHLVPMAAAGGPHYGDNVKLAGAGKYRLRYTIHPPGSADNEAGRHFARHAGGQSGVQPWFKPFSVEFEFEYPAPR